MLLKCGVLYLWIESNVNYFEIYIYVCTCIYILLIMVVKKYVIKKNYGGLGDIWFYCGYVGFLGCFYVKC